ncbi:hypothetical protein ACFX1X_034285 [Malus domestica]
MGLRRSVRLNATISGAAPPPRVSTMGTTMVARSMVPSSRLEPCHLRLTAPRPWPKSCHPSLHGLGPKPRIRLHHILSSLLPPSNLLSRPSLFPPSNLLSRHSLLLPSSLLS